MSKLSAQEIEKAKAMARAAIARGIIDNDGFSEEEVLALTQDVLAEAYDELVRLGFSDADSKRLIAESELSSCVRRCPGVYAHMSIGQIIDVVLPLH